MNALQIFSNNISQALNYHNVQKEIFSRNSKYYKMHSNSIVDLNKKTKYFEKIEVKKLPNNEFEVISNKPFTRNGLKYQKDELKGFRFRVYRN